MDQAKNERCYVRLYNHAQHDFGRRKKGDMPELCTGGRSGGASASVNGRNSE
ncbi:hypothetical protein HanRHA438_Chr14g0655251 [Helianthus annuus]|nr:hypothetical protein HanHA89_Chr14g0572291 [Helianthus annuus]KAJ0656338.1 hypothetical protein HanLR1_Chr14g0534681 [Helianthus annuus]KAJ0659975.1 hypothetical protein HanOQP8_Chr14g0532381 [Helianthus annuus]KAJ0853788.1 hypothetical protein HanRHA438_Chr14g0655251 [Helianthus annuus]